MKFFKLRKTVFSNSNHTLKHLKLFGKRLTLNLKNNQNFFLILNLNKRYYTNINEFSNFPYLEYIFYLNKKKKIKFKNTTLFLSSKRFKNLTISMLFLNLILRHGLKQKTFNVLSSSINEFYLYFFFFNPVSNTNYYLERVILSTLPNITGFFLFENILKSLIYLLSPLFNYKISKLNKKRRKKKNIKYSSKVIYITTRKRKTAVFSSLLQYSRIFLNTSFRGRLAESLFKTFIEQEDSYLYKKKLFSYNKFLKSKSTKVV